MNGMTYMRAPPYCNFVWNHFSQLTSPRALWWANDTMYYRAEERGSVLTRLNEGFCRFNSWYVQQVGAFKTQGGYDWTSVAWENALHLDQTSSVSILGGHWTGLVNRKGVPLGLPPLHVHHMHLNACDRHHHSCGFHLASRVIEHHGDAQFTNQDGGMQSFGRVYGGDYGKRVESLGFFAELNDVRSQGAPTLEWFVRIAILVMSDSYNPNAALSVLKLTGPMTLGYHSHFVHYVPTDTDSILWFASCLPHGGRVLEAVPHAHAKASLWSLLAVGDIPSLGMDDLFPKHTERRIIPLQSTGEAKKIRNGIVQRVGSAILCNASWSLEYVNHTPFDRVKPTQCTWEMHANKSLTSFWAYGPKSNIYYKQLWFPEHAIWFLTYASGSVSHYDCHIFNLEDATHPSLPTWYRVDVTSVETTYWSYEQAECASTLPPSSFFSKLRVALGDLSKPMTRFHASMMFLFASAAYMVSTGIGQRYTTTLL